MAKKVKAKVARTLEQRLWDSADALRGNQEPSEYKHVLEQAELFAHEAVA